MTCHSKESSDSFLLAKVVSPLINKCMRLNEIERLRANDYTSDKGDLPSLHQGILRYGKKLPGDSGFYYSVVPGNYDKKDKTIIVYDPAADLVIGRLSTYGNSKFPLQPCLQVGAIGVDPDYRGRNIAKTLYGICVLPAPLGLGATLISGDSQTPGGRLNWRSLSMIPGCDVTGYIKIDADIIDGKSTGWMDTKEVNDLSAKWMKRVMKMGGVYLGKSSYGYVFEFQVVAKATELANAIKSKIKVYDNQHDYTEVGLLAKYVG